MTNLSKTQIDRLGDRLRKGSLAEADQKLLDDYRRSFAPAYETVVQTLCDRLHLKPTGRFAKSTSSLVEKLRRESVRLSQIQDIAGCRIIVPDVAKQEQVVASLRDAFPNASVIDRRIQPSHGYRAIHVVVSVLGRCVEIQVRTSLQHLWAEYSEKFSDLIDPAIKYGGGDERIQEVLMKFSAFVAGVETAAPLLETLHQRADQLPQPQTIQRAIQNVGEELAQSTDRLVDILNAIVSELEREGKNHDLSD